jgi:ribosomal protein S18 acetylase RimI-like enzyme
MNALFSSECSDVDWDRLAEVFRRAPLGDRTPEQLREVFTKSPVRCFVRLDGSLIGAGRAPTDCVAYAVIFDVVLLPEFQNRGIGKQIMHFLACEAKAPNIILHSVPGKEAFYRRLGYRRMKTAMGLFSNAERQFQNGYIE